MAKILLIDDNQDIRENYSEILELAGHTVYEAQNGKIGVEIATREIPDIVLCDIMMDELDGYGVLHMLSRNPDTANIPFVFITARADRTDQRKGMEMGADDYLIKPFDDIELLNVIECRLNKKLRQQQFYGETMPKLEKLVLNNSGLPILKQLIENHKYRTFKKKQIVHFAGEDVAGIYMIISGRIKTVKMADDGRELITGIYEKDDFIGTNVIFSEDTYADVAIAMDDSTLCFFPLKEFDELLGKYPDIAKQFIKLLSNEIREKENQLLQIAYHSVRKRIAEAILRYARHNSKNGEALSLTRTDLAAFSGTATETVSRTLTEFKNEGLLEKTNSEIVILDYKKLQKLKN